MSRRGMLSAAVIAGLTLSGCSGGEQETPDDSTSSSPAKSTATPTKTDGPPRADASLVVAGPDAKLSATDISDGTKGDIIVPTGTVAVSSVESVEEIPGELVDATGTLLPAEGSEFVLVMIDYSPAQLEEGSVAAGQDDPLLEVICGEDATPLELPAEGEPATYLLSVPTEGDSAIAVSQSGLTQKVNLANGQRITNPVAQTYYRPTRAVDVEEGPTTSPATVDVVHDAGNTTDVTLSLDTRITRVALSPWVEGKGWAREGTAWLTIDGSLARQSDSGVLFPGQTQAKFTVEYGDGEAKAAPLTLPAEETSGEVHQALSVPVDIESATLVVTAGLDILPKGGYTVQGAAPVMFESDRVEVDLGSPVS